MENKKKLAFAIAKYLKSEMESDSQEDESLEVAIQCLENAFGISVEDTSLDIGVPLQEVFDAVIDRIESAKGPVNEEVKATAEKWKNQGNDLIKAEKFQDALECYNKAISLDGKNPVYYCNRAAAHSRLNNHRATIEDCTAAIKIDPTYSKAYGRMGLAYSSLRMFQEAKKAYLKAMELEPGNATYQNNYELNEESLRESVASGETRPFELEGLSSVLGNQQLMAMASQMLSHPAMQNAITNLISGNSNAGGMDNLLVAGQRLAQMMQNSNPELVEQLRQQTTRGNDPPQPPQN